MAKMLPIGVLHGLRCTFSCTTGCIPRGLWRLSWPNTKSNCAAKFFANCLEPVMLRWISSGSHNCATFFGTNASQSRESRTCGQFLAHVLISSAKRFRKSRAFTNVPLYLMSSDIPETVGGTMFTVGTPSAWQAPCKRATKACVILASIKWPMSLVPTMMMTRSKPPPSRKMCAKPSPVGPLRGLMQGEWISFTKSSDVRPQSPQHVTSQGKPAPPTISANSFPYGNKVLRKPLKPIELLSP
mmetsp:Transcript_4254/g.6937  ORF Transcript_4254/g.6937 Transcript_4254/m.6937 type:complete len:242 (+) Transcript_4254:411-1136(+)